MNPAAPTSANTRSIDLVCHPASPCTAPLAVRVQWTTKASDGGWALQLTYSVSGEVHRLQLPSATASSPADGLWAHTCFEAFVSEPGSPAYREFNFSPSTQWAHYRFVKERQRDPEHANRVAPRIQTATVTHDLWVLSATVVAVPLSSNAPHNLFAPTAVLETTDGQLSYWAVKHPSDKPDFHARGGWTIPLAWSIA